MRITGKRTAIATGVVSVIVLVGAGLWHREDIRWWWRMRGVVLITVRDQHLPVGLGIEDPAAISIAMRQTRALLRSLPAPPFGWSRPPINMPNHEGEVLFHEAHDWLRIPLYLLLYDRSGAILCSEGEFACDRATWTRYLIAMLGAIAQNPGIGEADRNASAAALRKIEGTSP